MNTKMHMENSRPIAARPFVQRIEEYCANLDRNELIETVIAIGLRCKPRERQAFLDEIGAHSAGANVGDEIDWVLNAIDALVDDIRLRLAAIADGSFWSDYAEEIDYSLDEDPPELTAEQTEELVSFFGEADSLFVDGRFPEARRVYEPLLSLFRRQEGSDGIDDVAIAADLDIREERARYARCVYETSDQAQRAPVMVDAMDIDVRPALWFDVQDLKPMLSDVVNASRGQMADFEDFLVAWTHFLEASGLETDRSQELYLEAIALRQGPSGLSAVARKWGGDRPMGYAAWIDTLSRQEEWDAVVDAAREALDRIPDDSADDDWSRGHAATALVEAGEHLTDGWLVLEGRRAIFRVELSDASLANLIKAAHVTGRLQEELAEAIVFLRERGAADTALYVKTLIIAGRLGDTLSIAKGSEPLGWTHLDRPAGLCFAAILSHRVVPDLADYPVIRTLLYSSIAQLRGYPHAVSVDSDDPAHAGRSAGTVLIDQAIRSLGDATLDPNLEDEYLRWAEQIGLRRIDAIVSNLHRGAYERAAKVLVALAERLVAEGRRREGLALVDGYRAKYNRHRAFKAELERVVKNSALSVSPPRGGPP